MCYIYIYICIYIYIYIYIQGLALPPAAAAGSEGLSYTTATRIASHTTRVYL